MANIEVRKAVAVDIRPPRAGTPLVVLETDFLCDVNELSPATGSGFIVEHQDSAVSSHQKIGPAIAVVVGNGNAVRVPPVDFVEPHLGCHILKFEVPKIAVEFAGMPLDLFPVRSIKITAAGHEDIQQSIPIVVNQGDPATEGFQYCELVCLFAVPVCEVESRTGSHVLEPGRTNWCNR